MSEYRYTITQIRNILGFQETVVRDKIKELGINCKDGITVEQMKTIYGSKQETNPIDWDEIEKPWEQEGNDVYYGYERLAKSVRCPYCGMKMFMKLNATDMSHYMICRKCGSTAPKAFNRLKAVELAAERAKL